eukprot:CAMPEP_0203891300 /NCGR_PEP_ID=MMETSP0359-20131031/34607_1 /ASSEMBLY_ACC=CAM_ASM_000338 /TAXON_ID=268821 /ORGANISM="Scrippsiella Hangoei, Strain SHTV-5" /LENGTH=274 /DNA_ID=CAMNT_0050813063 /DNA_START=42 /DNA_END=869 /DNA_ORIENTATION=+
MALNVIVKNTFLDLDDSDHEQVFSRKRSSSVPRAWKLRKDSGGPFDGLGSPLSFASTMASDGESSDAESGGVPDFPTVGRAASGASVKELLTASSPTAGDKKELYMLWEGDVSNLKLPLAAVPTEQTSPPFKTSKLNPAASEFKMPPPLSHTEVTPFGHIHGFPTFPPSVPPSAPSPPPSPQHRSAALAPLTPGGLGPGASWAPQGSPTSRLNASAASFQPRSPHAAAAPQDSFEGEHQGGSRKGGGKGGKGSAKGGHAQRPYGFRGSAPRWDM